MSLQTSIRGDRYESHFREGFLKKNSHYMNLNDFIVDKEDIWGNNNSREKIGDIDGYFILSKSRKLKSLLPDQAVLHDESFKIKKDSHVFFELTTTEGYNLQKSGNKYMTKKFEFHSHLINGRANLSDPKYKSFNSNKNKHVLVLIFNGADHNKVGPKFKELCDRFQIKGTTAYIGSDIIDNWALSIDLNNAEKALEEEKSSKEDLIKNLILKKKMSYEEIVEYCPDLSNDDFNRLSGVNKKQKQN